jgi:hypothetical protein
MYKERIVMLLFLVGMAHVSLGQKERKLRDDHSGLFSLGTRNTMSLFSDDSGLGTGIGGQFRLQINDKLNTEWYADYIVSKGDYDVARSDYHIGWSVMYYVLNQPDFKPLLKPYLIAGHCFDLSNFVDRSDENNSASRTSMATQAGLGTHINFTPKFDCSLSAQYMLHFGKEIHVESEEGTVVFEEHKHAKPHGHLLLTISFNYKFADLW